MTETELEHQVLSMCKARGYLVHHCTDSRTCIGRGFPDLVIVGRHGVLFAELKTSSFSSRKPDQVTWGHALSAADNGRYRLWTIESLKSGVIERELDELAIPSH